MKHQHTHKKFNWGTGILLAIMIFFAGMALMLVIAMRHGSDLVADNYYERELAYQHRIESRRRAVDAGGALSIVSSGDTLVLTFSPSVLAPETNGTIHLYRPSDKRMDTDAPMAVDHQGVQRIATTRLAHGLWKIQAEWNTRAGAYYAEQPVVIQ